jgi:molecular chaperone DnaK (HSP70)
MTCATTDGAAALKVAAEKAKIELSTVQQRGQPALIHCRRQRPQHPEHQPDRSKLELMVGGLVERTWVPVRQALEEPPEGGRVDEVIPRGGARRGCPGAAPVEQFLARRRTRGVNRTRWLPLGALSRPACWVAR